MITLDHLMRPDNNLRLQTAVIGRARGFVGTYGGLSYLAPLLRVPAVGFSSSHVGFASWHLALAQRLFTGPPFASLATLHPNDLALVELLAGNSRSEPELDGRRPGGMNGSRGI